MKLQKQKPLYIYLCFSIMSQQLSTKVARVIRQRFLDLYGGKTPTPQQIVDTPFEKLRNIGLSNAKVNYVQNVARFELEHGMDHKKLAKLSDEEVIEYLTQIKGVGKWTTEMLLMFALCREDVFAIDDLGLQQAVIGLYELRHRNKKIMRNKILKISEQWSPYRTYACMYLWRWKDSK
jgi:DNA-3-methyladenine glycosylase II